MAFVRMLGSLLKDPTLGPRIVPIVADEARTFGMANLFRQVGIYSPLGQLYEPEDIGLDALLPRGHATARSSRRASPRRARSRRGSRRRRRYSVHGLPMLPFYIYYSMFGFQRVGDLIWAAADQRARGFLIGATAGRTTLGGEGLQHQDGTSHLVAATVPNCRAYDPAFAGELAVIVDRGMREMLEEQEDVFYYVTVMNENYAQPSLPAGRQRRRAARHVPAARIGPRRGAARPAARLRRDPRRGDRRPPTCSSSRHGIAADVWSVTSFSELARDGVAAETAWRRGTTGAVHSFVGEQLAATRGPIVIATDYVRAVPELIRAFLPPGRRYVTLGTDGFGRSDTRAALRRHFEVDAEAIVQAALAC